MNDASLRALLLVLAGITAGATLQKAATLAAPQPLRQNPNSLQLPGYRVQLLATKPGRPGRALSHNSISLWRIIPEDGGAPLMLTLVPVRARNYPYLQMAAFRQIDPDLTLHQRRLNIPGPQRSEGAATEQFALGRRVTDPPGSTTRLQSCITPGGPAGVTGTTLQHQLEMQRRAEEVRAPIRTAFFRLAGLAEHSRWECLAVQLTTPAAANSEQHLIRTWASVRKAQRSET